MVKVMIIQKSEGDDSNCCQIRRIDIERCLDGNWENYMAMVLNHTK
jgi:hypothetical protein